MTVRTTKTLMAAMIALATVFCMLLVLPREASALSSSAAVTLHSGKTLKETLKTMGYKTKKDYAKITELTIVTEPDAELNARDFVFVVLNLKKLAMLDLSGAALEDRSLPSSALTLCEALLSVKLPSDLISIQAQAFDGCKRLRSIDLPRGLRRIGNNAFAECESLTEVYIPESVRMIDSLAFYGCKNLTGVSVDPKNTSYKSVEGVLYTYDGEELHTYPARKAGAYSVLPGTKFIPSFAFADCGPNLTGITLPEGLEILGHHAFSGCTSLTSITIPEGVSSIDNLFRDCTSLTKVSLPKSLYFVDQEAFSGCTALKEITFPGDIQQIRSLAFEKCTALTDVYFQEASSVFWVEDDAFKGCKNLKAIHVPAGTTSHFQYELKGKIGKAAIIE